MKKIVIWSFVSLMLLTPVIAYGQLSSDCTNTPSAKLCNPIRTSDSITVFAAKIVQVFTTFFALMALIYVVFSGFRMMISQGDSEALTVAKNAFMWSIFGLILAMFAFVLITATGTFIGAKDPNADSYTGNNAVINPLTDTTFFALLLRLLTGFLSVAGLIAMFLIIIGGFRYVTSAGNEEQAENGKKTLQWAIIGLVVALLAYVITRATLTFFGG